jgi:hypothetical protein
MGNLPLGESQNKALRAISDLRRRMLQETEEIVQ